MITGFHMKFQKAVGAEVNHRRIRMMNDEDSALEGKPIAWRIENTGTTPINFF